ncbi:hypothetical protein [Endozoicomonas ascidiicola]|uniref:hypothetical protein n=1 Tax=Endozoicomonas ascidiicola TaxID=1698521 RepID=UPI00082F75DF|nr:hypothetical protein [Endozoicomonas ascidiicola]
MSFGLIRSAILQASEENGAGIQSWEAFTHTPPSEAQGNGFWTWLEKPSSWIPEAQGAAAKYTEQAWIKALNLAKSHPEQQVIAYKGGFGAGKTSHGKAEFGDQFSGSVAPDSAKRVVRKALPVSHATAHTQGSDMAFKLFNGLIKRPMGTIIYDSSLSSAGDVKDLSRKSSNAGKPLKVIDITRDDKARALAVLAREIDGEDPRIPLSFIEMGAERDRKQRPDCMNAILDSQQVTTIESKSTPKKNRPHTYEFHCADSLGADRQLVCTLKSGKSPIWNESLTKDEINTRLASQGIKFNTDTDRFEQLNPNEVWKDKLRDQLKKPVHELIQGLSDGEAKIRRACFSERSLPLKFNLYELTPRTLYTKLTADIRSKISVEAFEASFEPLSEQERIDTLKLFQQPINTEISTTYLDLPAVVAIELHRAFRSTPECWKTNNKS